MADVVVIGAGANGLVAANLLADRGLEVVVCEEQPVPGGAVKSAELTRPGFTHDQFSAFYPFAAASPVISSLGLEEHGLRWRRAPLVVAHPTAEGPTAVLSTDPEETAASLDAFAPGDGDGWRRLSAFWERISGPFLEAFFAPFPPVRGTAKLAAELRLEGLLELARMGPLPVRRLADEHFSGAGGGLLLAGNALHADLTPDSAGSAMFGWILCGLGQQNGFPVPEGGAGRLTDALVARLAAAGGELRCGVPVERIVVDGGRAVAVESGGERIEAREGIVADVDAPSLYRRLVGPEHLPDRLLERLERFQFDNSTVKVDWALNAPIPWESEQARRAGTVHVAESMDLLTRATTDLQMRMIPERPFLVMGQYAATDPTRAPRGAETAWAYTHVPQHARGDTAGEIVGRWDEAEKEIYADRIEGEVERFAPGFRDTIIERSIMGPRDLERLNSNLVGGAINAGTAQLYQQAIFRPVPGNGRAETPIGGLFLGSASAHPGGGVHGAPGSNAARALLAARRRRRWSPLTSGRWRSRRAVERAGDPASRGSPSGTNGGSP